MASPLLKRLVVRAAFLLLVSVIAAAEESDRKGRDSYLDAYVASHNAAQPTDSAYASPSQPTPGYAAPAPSYGPPHRGYPPPHHHLHHHAYGPPVVVSGGSDYGPDNGNGGEMTGGSGGVDIATFLHALAKILVIKIIVKLVAVIIALLLLPKIKEKKKKKPNKPHRPQYNDDSDKEDDDSDDDDDDDDDDRRRRRRSLNRKMTGFGTSSKDPRLLDLAQTVLQKIEEFPTDEGKSES